MLRVCVHGVCVCVHGVCVCTLDGLNTEHKFRVCHVTFTFSSTIHSKKKKNESILILIGIFIIVSLFIVNTQFEHEHCTVLTST